MIGCSRHALRRAAFIILAVSLVLAAHRPAGGQEGRHPLLGRPAPAFKISSGDDEAMTSDMIKGKVAVIFYETRDASRKNSDIKDRFNVLYDRQEEEVRRSIVRVPVFNCSRIVWPVTAVWKGSLRYHSRRVGIILYGDWDGHMAKDYRMKDHDSNVMIVDRKGIIRYAASGRITDEQFREIEDLLDTLLNKEK